MTNMKCGDKHIHKSRGAALAHIRSMVTLLGTDPVEQSAYACPRCKGWHVGRVKEKYKQKRINIGFPGSV